MELDELGSLTETLTLFVVHIDLSVAIEISGSPTNLPALLARSMMMPVVHPPCSNAPLLIWPCTVEHSAKRAATYQ